MNSSGAASHFGLFSRILQLPAALARLLMLAVAAGLSFALLAAFNGSLQTLEERLGALGWTLSPDTTTEQRITIVAIDEKSLAEVGPWPWSRQQQAELVTAIDAAGAQLQLHDITYPEAKPGDDALLAALQNARGAVIAQIPILAPAALGQLSVRTGQMSHALKGVACNAGAVTQTPSASGFLASHGGFSAIPKGHITPIIEADGMVLKAPAVICVDGAAYPSLALAAFFEASNAQEWQVSIEPGDSLLDPAAVLQLSAYPGLDIPLDSNGNMRISYAMDPSAYRAVSAVDVLNGTVDPGLLDAAWVVVGATAFGSDDIVPTPYNGATSGVELQARMLASLLDVAVPYTPAAANWLLALLSLGFAGLLYGLAVQGGRSAAYGLPGAALLLPLCALALHTQLLHAMQLWLGWLLPAIYGICAASALLLLEQSRVRMERSRVFSNLNSYLPVDMAKEIAYSLPNSSVDARRCNVTLLSADLRNFSAFSESRPAEETAAVLHYFFSRATQIIEQHGGRVHEFKGDSLLALWDGHDRAAAEQALEAAKAMQVALYDQLLPEHALEGLEPLTLGIGIEQGPVLIGSIGPAHRRSQALLGQTVGITLRIQEMTAELAQAILLGECVARQLGEAGLESQGSYLLSGLKIPHVLFAPEPVLTAQHIDDSKRPDLKLLSGGRRL